mmetsp:Transcript_8373/g.25094  ORF Transcript_8373/g.25094 Transcript_8373/m.25094 type:complete len:416 (+) Transcript_8373:301-1548(+)
MAGLPGRVHDSVDQPAGDRLKVLVGPRPGQDLQGLNPGGHGEGVARKRAGLVHGAGGRNGLHDILPAAVRSHGEATSDDLAHGGQVRGNAEVLLGAALGDPEPGHDLVEAQQGALGLGHVPQALKELLGGGNEPRVSDHGLKNDAGDLALVLLEELLHALQVVVLAHEGGSGGARGDSGRIGEAEGRHAAAGLNEEGVGVPVVAAAELDDLLVSGVRPHQPEHGEAGLRPGGHEAHHLHARHPVDHGLRHGVLQLAGSSEGRPVLDGGLQGFVHLVVGVPHDGGSPAADVVHVLVPVRVIGVRTLDPVKHNGLPANGLEGPDGGVHPAGKEVLGLREDPLALGRVQDRSRGRVHPLRSGPYHHRAIPLVKVLMRSSASPLGMRRPLNCRAPRRGNLLHRRRRRRRRQFDRFSSTW